MESHESAASDDANRPTNADDDTDINEVVAVTRGRRRVAPMRPPEALHAFVAPRVPRRRRSDWPVLVIALVVAGLVMAGCCIAGFALYTTKGGPFK